MRNEFLRLWILRINTLLDELYHFVQIIIQYILCLLVLSFELKNLFFMKKIGKWSTIVVVAFTGFILAKRHYNFIEFKNNAHSTLGYITVPNYNRTSKTTTGIDYQFQVENKEYTGTKQINSRFIDKIEQGRKVLVIYNRKDIEENTIVFDVDLSNYDELGISLDSVFQDRIDDLNQFETDI